MRLILPVILTFQFSKLDARPEILGTLCISLHEGLRPTLVLLVTVGTEFGRNKCESRRKIHG